MKKFTPHIFVTIIFLVTVFSGCGGGNNPGGPTYTPGESSTYPFVTSSGTAASFKMNYAPSGSFASDVRFLNDPTFLYTSISVPNGYWIAQTDVTYELWKTVYDWATQDATDRYYFAHPGAMDGNYQCSDIHERMQQPVTQISFWDAMVWCNALTEYYNATNGANYKCVYYADRAYETPIRNTNYQFINLPFICAAAPGNTDMAGCTAKGFRLPTNAEWELAARYQDGKNWTPGDHVSGDTSGYCFDNYGRNISSTSLGIMPGIMTTIMATNMVILLYNRWRIKTLMPWDSMI